MGLQYRTIRAAASALLVAAAVGTGGMGGLTSALAADPGTVPLAGTVVGTVAGIRGPVAGLELVITEESGSDGGYAAFPVTTGADGTFAADLFAWGTTADPAIVTIAPARTVMNVDDASCSRRWSVAIDPGTLSLDGTPPEALVLERNLTLLGEVCGTTTTPPTRPAATPPAAAPPANQPAGPRVTPPPTDALATPPEPRPDRPGPALAIGFIIGLLATAALLRVRTGARRRD